MRVIFSAKWIHIGPWTNSLSHYPDQMLLNYSYGLESVCEKVLGINFIQGLVSMDTDFSPRWYCNLVDTKFASRTRQNSDE